MNSSPRGGGSDFLKKFLALLCGLAIAYLFGEILTRIFVPDPAFRFENAIEMFQEDHLAGYKNTPDYDGYFHGFVRVQTNGLGYRGKEVSLVKSAGTFRILGLGDSVMFGVGVKEEVTYLRVLEQLLNAANSGKAHSRFEALNSSVVGYSTHQELLTLQRDAPRLSPDLVLVGFTANDFYPTEDPFYNLSKFHQPSKDDVRRRPYPPTKPVRLYLYRFLRTQAKLLRTRLFAPTATPASLDENPWLSREFGERGMPAMQEHFRTMKRLADERGFHLLILLFLYTDQLHPQAGPPFPQTQIADFLTSQGISFMDLSGDFRSRASEIFYDPTHLTPLGHRLTAETILDHLKELHWTE